MDTRLARVSAAVNRHLLRGRPGETLCGRAYRLRLWWAVWFLDWAAFFIWTEVGHCRRLHDKERGE